jgi:hypothetical protein
MHSQRHVRQWSVSCPSSPTQKPSSTLSSVLLVFSN